MKDELGSFLSFHLRVYVLCGTLMTSQQKSRKLGVFSGGLR